MKNLFLIVMMFSLGCTTVNKTINPTVFQPTSKVEEPSNLVPFTRELYNKIKDSKLVDITKIQFYNSNAVFLNQGILKDEISVDEKGQLKTGTLKSDNLIELMALTPGIIESIDKEGMYVRFEKGEGKALRFINNKYSPVFFSLSGNNWNNGTAFIDYAKTTYLASCGNCNSIANVKLLIRQIDNIYIEKLINVPEGIKVGDTK